MTDIEPDWYTAVQQRARDEAATVPEPTVNGHTVAEAITMRQKRGARDG